MATALNPGITPIWPLSVPQYHRMIDQGTLGPDDPVELLDGVIVQKMSKTPPHRIATRAARQALERIVPSGWYVDEQEPITLTSSEPEPDVAVIRGDSRDYRDRHPGAADVALVVEVADATIERDRMLKKHIYTAAGISVYWLIDLNQRIIEVFSMPSKSSYKSAVTYRAGESITLDLADMRAGSIAVKDLMP